MGSTLVVNHAVKVQKNLIVVKGFNYTLPARSLTRAAAASLLDLDPDVRFWDPAVRQLVAGLLWASRTPHGVAIVSGARFDSVVFHFSNR